MPNIITPVGTGSTKFFGANWLNFTLYFPQVRIYSGGFPVASIAVQYPRGVLSTSHYTQNFYITQANGIENMNSLMYYYYDRPNNQLIAATDRDTRKFARSDIHYTDFVEVDRLEINDLNGEPKGFIKSSSTYPNYKNGSSTSPLYGGKVNAIPTGQVDPNTYFYKGFGESDCIKYLISLGIL